MVTEDQTYFEWRNCASAIRNHRRYSFVKVLADLRLFGPCVQVTFNHDPAVFVEITPLGFER